MKNKILLGVVFLFLAGLSMAENSLLPKLSVDKPPKFSTTTKPSILISGKAYNAAKVTLNGKPLRLLSTGKFSSEVRLRAGVNNITVHADNDSGSQNIVLSVTRVGVKAVKSRPVDDAQIAEKSEATPTLSMSVTKNVSSATVHREAPSKLTYELTYPPQLAGGIKTVNNKILLKFKVSGARDATLNGKKVPIRGGVVRKVERLPNLGRHTFKLHLRSATTALDGVVNVDRIMPVETAKIPTISSHVLPKTSLSSTINAHSVLTVVTKNLTIKSSRLTSGKPAVAKLLAKPLVPSATIKAKPTATKTLKPGAALKSVQKSDEDILSDDDDDSDQPDPVKSKPIKPRGPVLTTAKKAFPFMSTEQVFPTRKGLPEITLQLRNADVKDVVEILSRKSGLNIVADESLTGKVSISLNRVPFASAFDMILQTYGYAYTKIGNTIIVGSRDKISVPTSLETRVFRLYHAKAPMVEKVIQPYLAKDEKTSVAQDENSIIVFASPYTIEKIGATIANLDKVVQKQVFIEAKVIEIGANELKNHGIDWGGAAKVTQVQDTTTAGDSKTTLKLVLPDIVLNYLNQSGTSKVLASPKMAAIDGQQASILVGDRYPYTVTNIDGKTGVISNEVKFVESGIKLNITPYINAENSTVELEIKTEVSFIYSFVGPNNSVPWVRTREASTKVRLKNGQTAVIGGLLNSEDAVGKSSIPVLSDIPLIGGLFSTSKNDNKETELLLTLTPKIID